MKRLTGLVAALLTVLSVMVLSSGPATALPPWQDTATSWTNPRAHDPRVVGLRYATHPNFDRVVIDVERMPSGNTRTRRRSSSSTTAPVSGWDGRCVRTTAHPEPGAGARSSPRDDVYLARRSPARTSTP